MSAVSTEGCSINLMPMMDIFSILITFLLMNFGSDPLNYKSSKSVVLPESRVITSLDSIPTVLVTKSAIYVHDKKVANIQDGDVEAKSIAQGAIYPLYKELEKVAQINKGSKKIKQKKESQKIDYLTLELDKNHPFKLIKRVFLSAKQAGFVAFNIMVAKSGR